MRWSIAHRGRQGTDTMQVQIGTPANLIPQVPNGQTAASISDGPSAWRTYTGIYQVPAGQTTTRFAFASISSSGGSTLGNFLDDVVFANSPCLVSNKSVANLSSTYPQASAVLAVVYPPAVESVPLSGK